MIQYSGYQKYKKTRCDWLQEIPEHWQIKRIKNVATYNDDVLDDRTEPDFELEYVDISSVSLTNGIEKTEKIVFEKAPSRARRKVKDGDIVVSTVRTYLKSIAQVSKPPDNMIVSTGFAVIRPKENLVSGFAGYLLQSNGFVGDVVANSVGVSYPAINASDLVRIPAVEPPLEEQKIIARFLDYKTAQIDALIAKQKALLDKLAEKRTALISHAVNKGLDPTVPMKASGVEWLGEIPAHWKTIALHYVGRLRSGESITALQFSEDGEYPVFGGNGYRGKCDRFTHQGEYVLIGRQGALCGNINTARGKFFASEHAIVVNSVWEFQTDWMAYQLNVMDLNQYSVSAAQPGLSAEVIGRLKISFPTIDEQKNIANFLNKESEKIQTQRKKIEDVIVKLQEYRSALITNAVTGKIDVRHIPIPMEKAA